MDLRQLGGIGFQLERTGDGRGCRRLDMLPWDELVADIATDNPVERRVPQGIPSEPAEKTAHTDIHVDEPEVRALLAGVVDEKVKIVDAHQFVAGSGDQLTVQEALLEEDLILRAVGTLQRVRRIVDADRFPKCRLPNEVPWDIDGIALPARLRENPGDL